jgi:hypothetical protein
MKKISLLTILSLTVLMFAACGDGATNTANSMVNINTADVKGTVASNNSSTTQATPAATLPPDLPKTDLKPDKVDPNKPIPVAEMLSAYLSDKAAWNGKEVSVAGNYFGKGKTTSDNKVTIMHISIADDKNKFRANCYVDKEVPEEVTMKPENHVFKGTISEDKMRGSYLILKPCKLVK